MTNLEETLIGLSEIAELAGTRPSAVTNWRKRYPDFPSPVPGIAGSRPQFRLSEVESWLTQHNTRASVRATARPEKEVDLKRAIWEAANILRTDAVPEDFPIYFCAAWTLVTLSDRRLGESERLERDQIEGAIHEIEQRYPTLRGAFRRLSDLAPRTLSMLVESAARLAETASTAGTPGDIFEAILATADRRRRGESATSAALADLLVDIAAPEHRVRVLDPAAGEATALLLAAQRYGNRISELVGMELRSSTLALAAQRLALHGVEAQLLQADALDEPHESFDADIIFCDPPWGVNRSTKQGRHRADPRWIYAPPGRREEFLWLQHVIWNLSESGRGYVLLPPGSLFWGGADAAARRGLLISGAVEAIVGLPQGIGTTSIAPALWVLRKPSTLDRRDEILIIDGTHGTDDSTKTPALDPAVHRMIVEILRAWRYGELRDDATEIASRVSIVEALAADANLVPSRWVSRHQASSAESLADEVAGLASALSSRMRDTAAIPAPEISVRKTAVPSVRWKIRDLVADKTLTMIQGIRLTRDELAPTGSLRVFTTENIQPGGPAGDSVFVEPADYGRPIEVTKPGDVIATSIGTRLRAMIDREGGHAFIYPLQCLRINDDWLVPTFLAAFLNSQESAKFAVGAAIPRINVRDLEIPRVTAEEAARLVRVLTQLDEIEGRTREATSLASSLREALLQASLSGAVLSDQSD